MNYFNTNERKGVVVLLTLIVGLQMLYHFIDFSTSQKVDLKTPEIVNFQREIDSLKLIEIDRRKPKIYPFNPSFITDYKGYKLGMNIEEIDRLLAYRKTGKYINSTREFQEVTGISDSLLAVISPYFKFPDWVGKKNLKNNYSKKTMKSTPYTKDSKYLTKMENYSGPKKDLNTASIEELRTVRGIGEKLATRIIKYRTKLKGFMIDEQLYEVWYLDKEVAKKVLQQFTVLSKPKIERININTAQFKQVLHAPYMNYKLTKKIFEYRDEMAEIQSLEELKKIDSFPLEKFDRISLYLKVE